MLTDGSRYMRSIKKAFSLIMNHSAACQTLAVSIMTHFPSHIATMPALFNIAHTAATPDAVHLQGKSSVVIYKLHLVVCYSHADLYNRECV